MMKPVKILARAAGLAMATVTIWALGCEQIIGLDGPYVADPGGEGGSPGVCTEGATEECYSGDPALKGIGACQPGTRTCAKGAWGACVGEGAPTIEHCAGNDDDCNGQATCTGAVGWALSFGSAATDNATGIAADSSNNVIVAGSFAGTGAFGGSALPVAGGSDVVVFKLDPAGKHIWSKAFGSTGADNARGLGVDAAGNIVIAGLFGAAIDFGGGPLSPENVSMFVAKLDPNGGHVWSRAFTGASGLGTMDLAVTANGDVLISATLTGSMNFGAGLQTAQNESLAIVKLDASGNYAWSKLYGTSKLGGTLRSAIAVDGAGNVGIVGTFHGQIAFGTNMFASTKRDIFLGKLSPAGDALWSVQGTAAGDCVVEGLAFDKTGGLVLSGSFPSPSLAFGSNVITGYSDNDAYVVKFDSNGAYQWGKAFGLGGLDETGVEVDIDPANNISFAGSTTSNGLDFGTGTIGPAGLFIVKLDPTGQTIWARTTEVATTPYPDPAVAVDSQGHTLLARGFLAPMTIGGISLPSVGMSDMFVVKLGP